LPEPKRDHDLARRTGDDKLATRLVDGGFVGKESMGTDNIADAVSEEDEGGGGDTFGVAGDVGRGELQG
jgi:hypothetical protein